MSWKADLEVAAALDGESAGMNPAISCVAKPEVATQMAQNSAADGFALLKRSEEARDECHSSLCWAVTGLQNRGVDPLD